MTSRMKKNNQHKQKDSLRNVHKTAAKMVVETVQFLSPTINFQELS